ncbi:hypothetical protein QQF64_020706 [Cirrhinus molitorella]|uniref:Galectin n=1 Tax=Cirrhinus molitorella TaxID=172907 RepID=A0ABR3LCH3_9TELE
MDLLREHKAHIWSRTRPEQRGSGLKATVGPPCTLFDDCHIEGGSVLHFSFGLAVPPTPESVLQAQGLLCIMGRIGAFDVVASERGWENRSSGPNIVFDENEIFRGVIAQEFIGFSTIVCS